MYPYGGAQQPVYGYPQQGYPQQGYPAQQTFVTPGGYPQQQAYPYQQGYPQVYEQAYYPQQGYAVATPGVAVAAVPQQGYAVAPQQGYAVAPQQGYAVATPGVAVAAAPMVAAAPVAALPPGITPGQSVFTNPVTFQVRKNYTFEVGKGEMDIFMGGFAYYRLLSNPAPSHVFGWGHNYALYDLLNNQLAYIEQEVRVGMPHFNIYVRGQKYAKLKKEFTVFNKIFHLDSSVSGEHIRVKGDWFSMSFRFERTDGKTAATVMGNYANDMYDVTIQPGEDTLMILLAVLTVEKLSRDSK